MNRIMAVLTFGGAIRFTDRVLNTDTREFLFSALHRVNNGVIIGRITDHLQNGFDRFLPPSLWINFNMRMSNIFRSIAVMALLAMIGNAALQNTNGQLSAIAEETIKATQQPEVASKAPITDVPSISTADSARIIATTVIDTSRAGKATYIPGALSARPDTVDTVINDSQKSDEHSGMQSDDTTISVTADPIPPSVNKTTVATSPHLDSAEGTRRKTVPVPAQSSNAVLDSTVLKRRIPDSENVKLIQKQSQSNPVNDSLINQLFTDFGMPTLNLSLDEAIDYLLQFNPLVIAARLEWKSNERKALAALGPFEPAITGGTRYSSTGYNYRPFPEQNLEQSIGLKGRTITGAEYSIDYKLTDMRNTRSSLDQPQAFTGATITQPLLRNAWYGSELADRKVAIIDRESAYHTYRSKLIEMIAELQSAYWNLAFAQEKYRFALQSVNIAKKIVNDAKLRLKTGKMSMGDLIEAEAGLATRQANLADAGQELLDAANQLKLLLSTDDIGRDRLLFCTQKIFVNDSELVVRAPSDSIGGFDITNHPEYQIRKLELDKEAIIFKYRTGQCLPVLNAKGSCGISGYGSKAPSAMNRLLHDPQPVWSAILELDLPVLGGVQSRNLLVAQKFKTEAAQKNLSSIEYQIVNSIRIIMQRVAGHCEQARNAGSVVEFRQRLLDIEFKKLDAGKSTYRLIYETEEKLSGARQWQLESNVKYRMAIVQQAKITGSMLADFALETINRGQVILTNKLTQQSRHLKTPVNETK